MTLLPPKDERSRPDFSLGSYLYVLWLLADEWVNRRVESVQFIGANSMRRRVSVDFEIPSDELVAFPGSGLIPLALLEKHPLTNLDVSDEDGGSVSVLTRVQNGYAAWSMLGAVAQVEIREVLGRRTEVSDSLISDLREIALGGPPEAVAMLENLGSRVDNDAAQRQILIDSAYFNGAAMTLAELFFLLVRIDGSPGDRRVLKFSYAEPLTHFGRMRERFVEAAGWRPTRFEFETPGVGESESHHFEVSAPEGLDIVKSMMLLDDPIVGQSIVDGTIAGPSAHTYTSEQEPDVDGHVFVWLRPTRSGLLRSGLAVSGLILGVLLFFLTGRRLDTVAGDTATAILLSLPALVATLIVRPGEHGLLTDLLVGVRAAVAASGLLAYVGALLLVGGISGSALLFFWKVLVTGAVLCFGSLAVSYVGLRPKEANSTDVGQVATPTQEG